MTTYVSYKTLVRWRFGCALRGGTRGFWFTDTLGLRPRGLCTVATRARHVNHAPPSYNYNLCMCSHHLETIAIMGTAQIHISEISNYVLRINYTHTHAHTHARTHARTHTFCARSLGTVQCIQLVYIRDASECVCHCMWEHALPHFH